MIALLQRVTEAGVRVDGKVIGSIERGILALIGVEHGDAPEHADRLIERLLNYRVFPDAEDRMNLSVQDIGGGVLLVPQFTLAADTRKGNRPSFTPAAAPADGERLFNHVVERVREKWARVATGAFGADMQVSLVNDGPVTFWLRVSPRE